VVAVVAVVAVRVVVEFFGSGVGDGVRESTWYHACVREGMCA
jgi:hypothetical protein